MAEWTLRGVVMDLGYHGEYDDKSVESPTIIKKDDGGYIMWYRGQTYVDKIGRIMRATSSDSISWVRSGVVMVPSEEYEGGKIDPMTVIYEDGLYKMWYGAAGYGGCACYATSSDGINWIKYAGNPVLRKTSGSWDNEGAGGQFKVIKVGDKYSMYYKGYGSENTGWISYGLAESADGVKWIKLGKILSPDPKIGETIAYRNMGVFKVGDYYCIIYSMADYLQLFLATSKDGRNWNKNGLIFLRGQTPGNYDIKWTTSPCVIADNNQVRMWYEGGDADGRVRTLLAEMSTEQFLNICRNVPLHPQIAQ